MEMANQVEILRRSTQRRLHVALEWNSTLNKVTARRGQVGLSWAQACAGEEDGVRSQFHTRLVDGFDVPEELLELPNLDNVLTKKTWDICLSASERDLLSIYLPEGCDQNSTLQALLGGENFHFGNPLHAWGASVCAGATHPDSLLRRESKLERKRKAYVRFLRAYHGKMIANLQTIKQMWASVQTSEGLVPRTDRSLKAPQSFHERSVRHEQPKGNGEVVDMRGRDQVGHREGFQETVMDMEKDSSIRQKAKRQRGKPLGEGAKRLKIIPLVEGRSYKENRDPDFEAEWFKEYVEVSVSPLSDEQFLNASEEVKVSRNLFEKVKRRSEAGEEVHIDSLDPVEGESSDVHKSKKIGSSCGDRELVTSFWSAELLKGLPAAHSKFLRRREQQLRLAKALVSSCKIAVSRRVHLEASRSGSAGEKKGDLRTTTVLEARDMNAILPARTERQVNSFVDQWPGKHLVARASSEVGTMGTPKDCKSNPVGSVLNTEPQDRFVPSRWDNNVKDGLCLSMSRVPVGELRELNMRHAHPRTMCRLPGDLQKLNHVDSRKSPRITLSAIPQRSADIQMEPQLYTDPSDIRLVGGIQSYQPGTALISEQELRTGDQGIGLFEQRVGTSALQELQLFGRRGHIELLSQQDMGLATHASVNTKQLLIEQIPSHMYKCPLPSVMQPQEIVPKLQGLYPNYNLSSSVSLTLTPGVELAPLWSGCSPVEAALPQFGSWSVPDTSRHWTGAAPPVHVSSRASLQPLLDDSAVNPRWNLSSQGSYNTPDQHHISRRPEHQRAQQLPPFLGDWSCSQGLPALNETGTPLRVAPTWHPPSPFENAGSQMHRSLSRLWASDTVPPKAIPWSSMPHS